MLLKVEHKKAELNGQEVFVPDFARMSMKERNKVNNYADRYQERGDESPWAVLPVPLIMLISLLGTVATEGSWFFLVPLILSFGTVGLFACGGLVYMIYDVNRKPPLPKAEMVRKDDIRWRTLLAAFGDNQVLWDRMLKYISANKYWSPDNMNDVTRELEPVVSSFLVGSHPTAEGARVVRQSVERIFAELDQRVAEDDAVREAKAEVAAAEAKRLFDLEVQMARQDVSRHSLSSPVLSF